MIIYSTRKDHKPVAMECINCRHEDMDYIQLPFDTLPFDHIGVIYIVCKNCGYLAMFLNDRVAINNKDMHS